MEEDVSSLEEEEENICIDDERTIEEFKTSTFSGHKKVEVKHALLESMRQQKIEHACHWMIELLCAGHFAEIWDIFILFMGKHIHLGNPKMAPYLEQRYRVFCTIWSEHQQITTDVLELRNHTDIRKLFAEVVCNLTFCHQKNTVEPLRIKREQEFDMTQMTERFAAPTMSYAVDFFQQEDPTEIFVPINELAYQLSPDRFNMMGACYWISWIIEFEQVCKTRKNPCICRRRVAPVDIKYQTQVVWLIWDILKRAVESDMYVKKIMDSIFALFCIDYTPTLTKRRLPLLYFAVALITEHVPRKTEIITNPGMLEIVLLKIDSMFGQLKEQEMMMTYQNDTTQKRKQMENKWNILQNHVPLMVRFSDEVEDSMEDAAATNLG